MGRVLKESLLLQGTRSVLLGGWQQWWWVAEGAARATKWEKGALSAAPRLWLLFLGTACKIPFGAAWDIPRDPMERSGRRLSQLLGFLCCRCCKVSGAAESAQSLSQWVHFSGFTSGNCYSGTWAKFHHTPLNTPFGHSKIALFV